VLGIQHRWSLTLTRFEWAVGARVHRVISTAPAARQCAIGEHHESEASVNLQLAHPNPAYGKVNLIEPAPLGYLHIGAEVRPSARPGPVVPSRERSQLVGGLKVLGRQVERTEGHRVRGDRVRSPE
jgi:hypothetical protein